MRGRRWTLPVVVTAAVSLIATPIFADTVYLKNGRTLRSSSVRVEGDRVFVRLYGGEVAFPRSLVDRIVEDEYIQPEPTAQPAEPEPGAAPDDAANQGGGVAPPGSGGNLGDPTNPAGDPADASPPDAPPAPEPEQTREYWQARVQPLKQQLARIERELASLRSRNMADVQAAIERSEAQQRKVQGQLDAIATEARRRGIPPGWLR